MPFDMLKKKLGKKETAAPAEAAPRSKLKSIAGGGGFDAQAAALAPKDDHAKKSGGPLAAIKSALGLVKSKDKGTKTLGPDPKFMGPASDVVDAANGAANVASNIVKRLPQMRAELAADDSLDYFAECLDRCAGLDSLAESIVQGEDVVRQAFYAVADGGRIEPFLMAAEALLNDALAMRIALAGLPGPGDSVGVNGLMFEVMLKDSVVGGVLLGPDDEEKHGDTRKGPKGVPDANGGSYLPSAHSSISGAAIRAQAKHFVAYADNLAAKLAAIR